MKRILFIIITLCVVVSSYGQKVKGNDVIYSSSQGDMRISFISEDAFRVSKSTGKVMPEDENWMVRRYGFPQVPFTAEGNSILTSRLRIKVEPSPWRLEVADANGNILYKETDAAVGDTVYNKALLPGDSHFFGLGERMDNLDHRGQRVHLNVELGRGVKPAVGGKDILKANYCPVPLLLCNKGFAIFFHTAMPNDWDLGWSDSRAFSFSSGGGDNDYYFIYGPGMERMIHTYQSLTGRAPMMPRPAYGLHIGSYSGGTWKYEKYANDGYVVNLIQRLRREHIPFDLMWLDSTWRNFTSLGNGGCSFEFQESFKDPKGMIDTATANHVAMFGLHIRSLVDNGHHNSLLDEARKKGYTIQDGRSNAIIDFFNPKAVDWWWKSCASKVTDLGVKFFKTDVGSALRYDNATAKQKQAHNLFPIAYAEAAYDNFSKLNGQRGFDHTREGYAGIQRYPFIWAGDWGSEWQWFEPVIRGGLNIGLSGVGYWSHCMGGFEQYSPYDTDLYLRWCQMGMFSPVSILFGMDHPRYHAPWTYGEEAERIFIKYDSLRYTLLPYIYTAAHDMYETSRPLMAPLLMDYQQDENTYRISDQYMFGRSVMVCPVTVKGALSRPVYFPGGSWVDFWTGERIHGRQYKSFLTPIDIMPLFIKEGAIIPRQDAQEYVGQKECEAVHLLAYPSGRTEYTMYEDDGKSLDYQKGIYASTRITSDMKSDEWVLTIAKPAGSFKAPRHTFDVMAYLDSKPQSLSINGRVLKEGPSTWTWDESHRMVWVNTGLYNDTEIKMEVKL